MIYKYVIYNENIIFIDKIYILHLIIINLIINIFNKLSIHYCIIKYTKY